MRGCRLPFGAAPTKTEHEKRQVNGSGNNINGCKSGFYQYYEIMKKICSASSIMEAQIMLDLLDHNCISAKLFNEHAQGGLGDIPFTHAYPEVWVIRDSDFERGQAIVNEFEKTPVETRVVFCRACHEENPFNFQVCWQCGAGLELPSSREGRV